MTNIFPCKCLYICGFTLIWKETNQDPSKMFKHKGAVVVLLWIFSGSSVFQSLYTTRLSQTNITLRVGKVTLTRPDIVVSCLFFYPIFGWLADAKFGRYKVIKWSFILLMILSGIFCIISSFVVVRASDSDRVKNILLFWHVPMTIVTGGIFANILQFGTDQLYDASSSDIASFLRWTAWVWTLSGIAGGLARSCFCSHQALANLFLPAVASMAVSLDFLFNSWLVKDFPTSTKSFSHIYKVLHYAAKNKYPLRRAPLDWDAQSSARLDVGKNKYGGPFSEEEVEDVKTFFRMIAVLIVFSAFVGLFLPAARLYYAVTMELAVGKYELSHQCDQSLSCFQRVATVFCGDFVIIFVIPLLEFIFSFLNRWNLYISILKRAFIAMVLCYFSLISITLVVYTAQLKSSSDIHNGTCSLEAESSQSINYHWIAIPYSLQSAVQPLLLGSCAEFIIAQTPYCLKGFIVGSTFGLIGFFSIIGFAISSSFKFVVEKWLFYPYGCRFWYCILYLTMFFILILTAGLSFKCYKRRQREQHDNLLELNY